MKTIAFAFMIIPNQSRPHVSVVIVIVKCGVIVSGVIDETETYHLGFVSVTFEGRIRNVRVSIFMLFEMRVKIFQ